MRSFLYWVVFHCVYASWLSYPFICRWTPRLLPCPSYCKQCCDELWVTYVPFNPDFLGVNAQHGLLGLMTALFPVFSGISMLFSIAAVPVWIPINSVRGFPFLHTLYSIYYLWNFWWQPFWLVWDGTSLWLWFAFIW